jgi:hypothetical protein
MEADMAYFNALTQLLPGLTEENHENPVRLVGVLARIQSRHYLNTSLKYYNLSQPDKSDIIFFFLHLSVPSEPK